MSRVFNTDLFLELYRKGMDDTQIASEMGYTIDKAKYWRRKLGLAPNTSRKKITKEVEDKILELYNNGNSIYKISKIIGINYITVSKKCKNMGLIIGENRKVNSSEEKSVFIKKYLINNGPTEQNKLMKNLEIKSGLFKSAIDRLNNLKRVRLIIGLGGRSHTKYSTYDVFGEHAGETIWFLDGDERIVNVIAEKIQMEFKSPRDRAVITNFIGSQVGKEISNKIINKLYSQGQFKEKLSVK